MHPDTFRFPAPARAPATALPALAILALALLLAGCGIGPDRVQIESIGPGPGQGSGTGRAGGRLEHRPRLVAYRSESPTRAEILATDLPIEALDPARGFAGLSGQITRVRMFNVPIPGRTPVSSTAGNTVVQHVVIHDGLLAVYSGSGLLRPRQRPGADPMAVVLSAGTLRLTRQSGPLEDPIGTARLDLWLTAPLNAPLATLIATRLEQVIERTQPITDPPAPDRPTRP